MGLEGRIVGGLRPYDGVVDVRRNRMERAGFVWVGHSCPTLLTLSYCTQG